MAAVLDRFIEQSPGVRGGQPRIAGTRLTVADIKLMYLNLGQSLEEIAADYNLPLSAVYAAVAYYYDHQAEIDHSIAESRAYVEAMRRGNPSLLQERLRSLRPPDAPHIA